MKNTAKGWKKTAICAVFAIFGALATMRSGATTANVPTNGVYKFTFGVDSVAEGFAVPASAVYDVQGTGYYDGTASATFSYGFLGTTEDSYKNDVPVGSKVTDPRQIDGFSVVEGQYIVLSNAEDANGVSCVKGPAASGYLPAGASSFEGRYPVRFAMRAEERAYYAVTCTVANASSTANADVTLYSERSHLHAHHMTLAPGETRTFAWSVELAPNYAKAYSDSYRDNAINVCVVGENAALASVTVVKQPQVAGTVRGEAVDNMNVGKSIWICTDSTGCDYPVAVPFFSGQNYGGVGAGLSRWAPANISICNQGEGGLATGSDTHRKSCLLKPGDYLYVEYGHNDKANESYTNNFERYLTDAKTAGAKLLIVSPVERHTSWNDETKYWNASLAWYREAGRAWVEAKIAQGETCVAFVDLNTHYLNWMNSEVDRICEKAPSMNRKVAINYYYQSAKGKNVDGTHLNTFGEDQSAYYFWQAALAVVAAGESAEEGTSAKIQADVVRGITEGYQDKLGLGTQIANEPYLVSDEIIAAGVAPNTFWDTPVTTMLDYVNDVAVADVAASTNADGTVTISGATLRVLNISKYCKAVYDIVSADGATTNRYYSYYNYDTTPFGSGDFVVPEQPGFIDSDKAAGGEKDRETLTIPAGGKAYVWFAVADDQTWQVGEAAPCSAIYPVEAWSRVLVDDKGDDATKWSAVTQSEYTFGQNDAGYYEFTGTGYDSGGTKKNFGMFRPFDDETGVSGGRYRVSFKVLYTAGSFTFCVQKAKGTTTSPTDGAVSFVKINKSKAAEILGQTTAEITLVKDANEVLQPSNRINVDAWTDVDMIVDMDLGTAEVSVGGSDYETYTVGAYSQDTAIANLPYNFFCFSLESQMSHFGALDDVKVVQLSATSTLPNVTVSATASDGALGTVTINGESVASADVELNSAVTLVATPAEGCIFLGWLDENSEYASTEATWNIARCHNPVSVTADFRSVVNASATSADETMGMVKINGGTTSPLQVYSNTDIAFTAVSADPDMYAFVCWRDADGNDVTSNATFVVENVTADCSYTANFREYGRNENRVTKWDFSAYQGDFEVSPTEATIINDGGMIFSLQSGDSMTGDGLYWHNSALGHKSWSSDESLSESGDHYIIYTPLVGGTLTLKFSIDNYNSSRSPQMFIMAAESFAECTKTPGDNAVSVTAKAANTEYTLSAELEAGRTYYIWTYSNNWVGGNYTHNYTIPSITYTYAPVRYTATAAVGNPGLGGATVNGGASAEVLAGKSATFTAWPVSGAYKFVNWTDAGGTQISASETYTTTVTDDITLTANFAALGEEDYTAEYGFVRYDEVSYSAATIVSNGIFAVQMVSGDSMTENGAVWYKVAVDGNDKSNGLGSTLSEANDHYIKFTAQYDGTVSIKAYIDYSPAKTGYVPAIQLKQVDSATDCVNNNGDIKVPFNSANTEYILSSDVEQGKTYYVWVYGYNNNAGGYNPHITISSITYTHASDTTTLTLTNDSEAGAVAVNGVAGVTSCNVQKGEYVKLSVAPNARSVFGGWKNADDETVSEDAEIWVLAEDAISLTTTWRTADVHNFVWNPAVASGNWNDAANWLYEGVVPAETYPSDVSQDVVTFGSTATISFTENAAASNIFANVDVTFTSSAQNAYRVGGVKVVGGEGTISLANSGFYNLSSATISNNICFVEGTTNTVSLSSGITDILGDFTGTGVFKLVYPNSTGVDARLYGNNNEYYGEVYTSGGKSNRNALRFMHSTSAGTNSYWHVAHSVDMYNDDASGMGSASIGGYDGAWFDRYDGYTITVGYLNRDSAVSIYNGVSGRANNIIKVGTANLTLGTTKIKNLTVNGGSVTMPVGIAPNTLTLAAETEIRIPGDASWGVGTETNLFSYTTLAGTGAETLASQVKVTGLADGLAAEISVEDKVVKATIIAAGPTTDDENAVITDNGDGSYSITVQAEEVTITVPDGVTVSEVIVSTNTTTVTGFPAGAEAKVAVSWEGGEANYAIVNISTDGAVTLDEDAVVTVGEEDIPLKPEIAAVDEDSDPFVVGADVSVGVKSIPGLVYRLVRGSAPGVIDQPVATQKASASRVSLTDETPPADMAFYRVAVDVK